MGASHLLSSTQQILLKSGKKWPIYDNFVFRKTSEMAQNCRKSGIFYPIWANFVALTWEMSSKCDAPIGKNKIVFKPLI